MDKNQYISHILYDTSQRLPLNSGELENFYIEQKYVFLPKTTPQKLKKVSGLNRLKEWIKGRSGGLYNLLMKILAPAYCGISVPQYCRSIPSDKRILNLGSGTTVYTPNTVNLDKKAYETVDIVADMQELPIQDRTFDHVVSISAIQQLPEPQKSIDEIHRVLKPQGEAFVFVPFMQALTNEPDDMFRFTEYGLRHLFRNFEIMETRPVGPTSSLLWVLQEWLNLILSLGIKPLYPIASIITMCTLFPLKWLDLILAKHPMTKVIANGWLIVAKKR